MAGPGILSTILDTTGQRLKERVEMEKDFRKRQSDSIIDSLHAINEDGTPKLSVEQQEQAWEELNNLNKAKGAKQILGKAREIFDMIGHTKKRNNPMAERAAQQTQAALDGQAGGNLVNNPETAPAVTADTQAPPALPFTPPPPGGRLQPVQATANAAIQAQPQAAPQAGPTPPPARTSMAGIIAAGSPSAQKMLTDAALAKTTAKATAEATKDIEGYKTTQVEPRVSAEEKAKLAATYKDPVIFNAMLRMKVLDKSPLVLDPGQHLAVPKIDAEGNPIYTESTPSSPRRKAPEENLQDSAVMSVLQKHGHPEYVDSFDPNIPYMQQLPNDLKVEAAQEYERIKDTPNPSIEAMRLSMQAMRDLEMSRIKMEIDKISQTRGPEAMENWRTILRDNPNAISEVPIDIRGLLTNYMKAKGDRVPRPLSEEMKQTDFYADQTLYRIQRTRDLIAKHPELIGPVANALGKGQEVTGLNLQGDPQLATDVADLRGSLEFLRAAETKALLGARPAFQWAEVFNKVTASQKDSAPVMKGALDMQEAHAKMIKKGIDDQRYGTQAPDKTGPVRMKGPGGTFDVPANQEDIFKANGYVRVPPKDK